MKQLRPILISRAELEKAIEVMRAQPQAPYMCFYDYEIGEGQGPAVPLGVQQDIDAMMNGTHPMFSREYVEAKLTQIKKECAELGIVVENRPMHEVLIELNAKRKLKGQEAKTAAQAAKGNI